MSTRSHVLVAIDHSPAARRAVGYGAALADKISARLSFAHVQPPSGSIVELEANDHEGKAMMAAIAADYPHVDAPTSIIVSDDIACAICESFPEAIVVVGSDHAARHADSRASIAEALIRNAHDHPILVVGPRVQSPSFDGPIAVALDGSTGAEAALLSTLAWARAFDVSVQLLQVLSPAAKSIQPITTAYLQTVQNLASVGGITAESYVIVDDDPVAGLVRHLVEHNCSLIAISTHSRESVARLALGSVTMGLVAESPCTVCAVHPDAPPPAALPSGSPAEHAQLLPRSQSSVHELRSAR